MGQGTPRAGQLWRTCAVALGLALLVAAIYGQVRHHGFVNVDDQQYIYENPHVLQGLSWAALRYAFTTFAAANWHPLTWLSHLADVTLFGLDAGGHHLTSALLHALDAILLFVLLQRMTGAPWRSATVAALFAVHPLHVESVAWISERKDVLSAAFFLLTLLAYVEHVRRPTPGRYAVLVALFALGLLAKPMLVTLPFVLLLLDAWPLRRMDGAARLLPLVREKLPLFALAAASSVMTSLAQHQGGAAVRLEAIPLPARLSNALVSYGAYLEKTVWPSGLASFYPHPALAGIATPWWALAASGLALALISLLAWHARRDRPYLAVGWLWFVGMLVPVIGIVQVGVQSRADRYTYLPLIGLFIAVVWTLGDLAGSRPARRVALAVVGAAVLLGLSVVSYRQVGFWRDSLTLHRRSLDITQRNWLAWVGLADAFSDGGRPREAIAADQQALRIRPDLPQAWNGMGASYGRLGQHEEAIRCFREALRADPGYAEAWYNLGTAYGMLGRHADAAAGFREAVRLRPDDVRALANLAVASELLGDRPQALANYRQLERLDPQRAEALRRQLGWTR